MQRLTLRLAVAALTFIIGVAVASVWIISHIAKIEEPPCHSCATIYSSASEVQNITLCELSSKPELYKGKIVRIRAIFQHDSGTIILTDHKCEGGGVAYSGLSKSFARVMAPAKP